MGFSLQGFGAGFASKLTDRLDEDRQRQEKLQDEARSIATRQRLAKQAKRDEEKRIAEETIGMLTMLGYSEKNATDIAGRGRAASQFAIQTGQQALQKGKDINTILSLPTINTDSDAAEIVGIGELSDTDTVFGGFDRAAYQSLYEKPDEKSNSFGSALARISQDQLATDDPAKIQELENDKQKILKDLRAMKETENIKDGEKGPSFTLGTVQSNVSSAFKMQLSLFDLGMDMEGRIIGEMEGKEAQAEVARLRAADYLEGTYGSLEDAVMDDGITTLRSQAAANLKIYIDSIEPAKVTALNSQEDLKTKMFSIGEVVSIPNLGKFVYTQVVNPVTGLPFY